MAEGELPGTSCVVGFLLSSSKIFAYDIIRDRAVQQAVTYILEPQPIRFNTSLQNPCKCSCCCCVSLYDVTSGKPDLLIPATRESAFVHAIASAGVAFAVTRACAEGSATICGCDNRHKGPPGEGWKWGGCSEDVEFGTMVSREFADARENRPDSRSAMNRHNNEAGRMVGFHRLFFCLELPVY